MLRISLRRVLQALCAAGLLCIWSSAGEACLFPCLWGHGWGYPAPYYGAPAYGGYGSPCGPGGCGVGYYRGVAPCPCDPCACAPCGTGCATGGCGVSYYSGDPVPDPAAGNSSKTYSNEQETSNGAGTGDMPPTGTDDFEKSRRGTQDGAAGTKPDPFVPPVTPEGATPAEGEPNAIRPLEELDSHVTVRVAPIRSRVRIEAQYRLPQVARLTVEPRSPWLPAVSESALARK